MLSVRPHVRTRMQVGQYGNLVACLVLYEGDNSWYRLFLGLTLFMYVLFVLTEDKVDDQPPIKPSTSYQYGDFSKKQASRDCDNLDNPCTGRCRCDGGWY